MKSLILMALMTAGLAHAETFIVTDALCLHRSEVNFAETEKPGTILSGANQLLTRKQALDFAQAVGNGYMIKDVLARDSRKTILYFAHSEAREAYVSGRGPCEEFEMFVMIGRVYRGPK